VYNSCHGTDEKLVESVILRSLNNLLSALSSGNFPNLMILHDATIEVKISRYNANLILVLIRISNISNLLFINILL